MGHPVLESDSLVCNAMYKFTQDTNLHCGQAGGGPGGRVPEQVAAGVAGSEDQPLEGGTAGGTLLPVLCQVGDCFNVIQIYRVTHLVM